MGDVPSAGQLALLFAAIVVFSIGGIASRLRFRAEATDSTGKRLESLRILAKACLYGGTLLTISLLVWHCQRLGSWKPLDDNFGAFVSMGILLCFFVIYTQRAHPLRGLDFFIMPVVILLLALAAIFGKTLPHEYRDTTWSIAHRVSAYGGFVAFAVAGAMGGMYLIANRRLRQKRLSPGQGFGSLERLEHTTFISVTLGFALLSIALVTGLVRQLEGGVNKLGPDWYPKVILTCVAWVVYALVLHSPINPSFRGRRTAILSVFGFALMIGVFVVIQFIK